MICPPLPPHPFVRDWLERHRAPASFWLHMLGIPATILGGLLLPVFVVLLSPAIFLFALAIFVGGYLIQFLGHAIEGSEPGEVTLLRKKLARSLAKVAPKAVSESTQSLA
jgi:uncharacterized membrane protein YGL010W